MMNLELNLAGFMHTLGFAIGHDAREEDAPVTFRTGEVNVVQRDGSVNECIER